MARRPGLFDPCPCGSGQRYHACCKPLGAAARDPDQLVALGVRRHAERRLDLAEDLYRKALRLEPRQRDGLRNLAILLTERGEFAEAEALLRRCLEVDPDSPHAHFALGVALLRLKRVAEAAQAFRGAHERDPGHLPALVNLGTALAELGRREEAAEALERALALEPRSADALLSLAILRSEAGDHAAALELAAQAREAGGGRAHFWHTQGVLQLGAGMLDEAIESFQAAVAAQPDHVDALVNLGSSLGDVGRPGEAILHFQRALALERSNAGIWSNLGLARLEAGRPDAAAQAVARAAELAPEMPLVLGHQGLLAAVGGRLEESEAKYRAALAREPASASFCIGLGTVLYERGELEQTAALYRDFVRAHPASASIRFELAAILLELGRFADGWAEYAYRPHARARLARGGRAPTAEELRGRRAVVHWEQGLGDQIFFLRFTSRLRALAEPAEIVFVSRPELRSIARRVAAVDAVTDVPLAEPGLLLGDLPVICAAHDATFVPAPYRLGTLPEARARAVQLLERAGPPPYLAVTWEAGMRGIDRRDRRLACNPLHKRIDPRRLGAAVAAWSGTVLSLQRLPRPEDHAAFEAGLGRPAADLSAANQDLETMLALLEALDEYVGVSNTNMHLRAAAGRTARVLVPRPYEWRWMAAGEFSPWFPGFRIYREERPARWKTAFADLARDLEEGLDAGDAAALAAARAPQR